MITSHVSSQGSFQRGILQFLAAFEGEWVKNRRHEYCGTPPPVESIGFCATRGGGIFSVSQI